MERLTVAGLAIAGLVILGACAGRDARPVDAWTPYDKAMGCDDLAYEIQRNNKKIRLTVAELEESKGQNVGVGVVGALLFWPALFALDLSDAERTEIAALEERNSNLTRLAYKNDCGEVGEGLSFQEAEQERVQDMQNREKTLEAESESRN